MRKRLLSILLVLCMVLSMVPVSALAAEPTLTCTQEPHTHTADCYEAEPEVEPEVATLTAHAHDDITFDQPLSQANFRKTLSLAVGNYYLTEDITLYGNLTLQGTGTATKEVRLCLNGKKMNLNGKQIVIGNESTDSYYHLYLYDCDKTTVRYGQWNTDKTVYTLSDTAPTGAYSTITGGVITGSADNSAIKVFTYDNYTTYYPNSFTMYGGTIAGNKTTATGGGGIYVYSLSSATIDGGNVIDNIANNGGGIFAFDGSAQSSKLTLKNCTISGNEATQSGGGIYVNSKLDLGDAVTISNNKATKNLGGGLYIKPSCSENAPVCTATQANSIQISGNTAKKSGGGMYFEANSGEYYSATLQNALISNNTAYGGGGIHVQSMSTLTLKPTVTISDNSATGSSSTTTSLGGGGGVYLNEGSLLVDGSTITGNSTAFYGGGIYAGKAVSVMGAPNITGNTKTDNTANNVFLDNTGNKNHIKIYIENKLTQGAQIGVTIESNPVGNEKIQVTAYYTSSPTGVKGDYSSYFISDNSAYEMCNDANNLLQMQVLTPAPTITVQPAATTAVTAGNISGSLSITATGEEGATLSYQWQKKGTGDSWSDISGETNTSYSIPTDLTMGSHDFRCVVTATKDGATRTTTSNTATVTVKAIISGVVVTPYNAAYDGQTHDKCIVSGYPEDSTVTYSENGESFSSTTPTVKDATTGSPFWVRVEHDNYATWTSGKLEAVVSKVQLTVSDAAIASTKEYDGNLAASVTTHGTLSGLVSGETLKLTCTATYADKNVGTDKAVTLTYELADDTSGSATYYANNYIAPASSTTTTAAITAKPLTVTGASATNREYDGTTAVAITGGTLDGVVAGDTLTLSGTASGTVENADVGDNKSVTVTGFEISGTDVGNYTLTQPTDVKAVITARPITVTASAQTIAYGSNISQTEYSLSQNGLVSGHTAAVSLTANTTNVTEAGEITPALVIRDSSNADVSGNYNITIAKGKLVITGAEYPSKPPAPSLTASFGQKLSELTLPDVEGGTWSWKDGTAIPTVGNSGYAVTFTTTDTNYAPFELTAMITVTPKALTLPDFAATARGYDGATAVAFTTGQLNGLVTGFETVTAEAAGVTAAAESADAGTQNITLTGSFTLTGEHAANYTLTQPSGGTVFISQRAYGDGTGFTVASVANQPYTGSAITPEPEVKFGSTTLAKGTDYTLTYKNNTAVGEATITINFQGNFSGSTDKTFQIVNNPLDKSQFETVFGVTAEALAQWHKTDIVLTAQSDWNIGTSEAALGTKVTLSTEGEASSDTVYAKAANTNKLYQATISYKLDKTPPTITNVTGDPADWTKDDAAISFTASDALSGVKSVTVKRGESDYAVTNSSFTADQNGDYIITVTDNAGNLQAETVTVTKISKLAPALEWNEEMQAVVDGKWYGDTIFGATATAAAGGTPTVTYTVNGKATTETNLKQTGIYTIVATATDDAGNTASISKRINIEMMITEFVVMVGQLGDGKEADDVMFAKSWYDALTDIQKDRLSKNDEAVAALEKLNGFVSDAKDAIAGAISDDIKNPDKTDSIDEISDLKGKFDQLPDEIKDLLPSEDKATLEKLVEDAKKAQNVIDQLEAAAKPGASYEEKESAKDAYDQLNNEQKKLADKEANTGDNYTEISKDLEALDRVLYLLDKVKKPYTADAKDDISAAKDGFNGLTDDQKSAFPKTEKDKLDDLTGKLDRVEAVENQIKALPSEYPKDDSKDADIMGAKVAYDALSDEEKSMIDPDLKAKLDELYKDMLDSKSEEEKKKLEAAKGFTDKVNNAKNDPTPDKIKDLIGEKENLPEGVYESLPASVKKDYDDLEKAKDIIEKLDKVTKDNITDSSGNGTISKEAKDAVDNYDKASDAIKDIVDKATDNKADDIKDVADALDKINKIPGHKDEVKDPDTGEITKPSTGIGEDCKGQTDNKHTSDDHQKAIEDAKDALEKLPDSAKDLIPDDKKELVDTEYEKLLGYLEYVSRAVTYKTEVEVVGITDKVALPAGSATAGKTIIQLVAKDSRPSSMPVTPAGKVELLSVDVKLVASLYANASDTAPVATETVQPKPGKTVLVKLLVPTGYENDTLEIWHVKDHGLRSRITNFRLTSESGGVYAVFEVGSFSHFVFFAEKKAAPPIDPTPNPDGGGGGGGSTPTTPKPSIPSTDNGSTTITPAQPKPGDKVTVTPKPDEGYVMDKVVVTDQNGKDITVKDNGDGTYSYTQPNGKVTVTVTFKPADGGLPFADVPGDAYYRDAVEWAVEQGVTTGTSATTFSPDIICTRAQTVTFLWRAMGSPEPTTTINPFTDVSADAYYYKAVLWATERGITKGTGATTFSPDMTVTRSQTVTLLYRAAGSPAADAANPFADVKTDAYYTHAVLWAVKEGITSGTSTTTFSPIDGCSRAQIVTFLYRYLGK